MPQFRYVARDTQGKLVDGVLTCNDRAAAIRQVEQQRFTPIKIESLAPAAAAAATAPTAAASSSSDAGRKAPPSVSGDTVQTLGTAHQYLFTEQLAHLLTAGMTLDEALGVLEKRLKHPKLNSLSGTLHRALLDGRSLSQALRDFPRIFSPLYVNLVSAGEASGALADILKRLVAHLADVKSLRDRVQQALIYPAVLIVAGLGLIVVFMTVMVPKLTVFFKGSGQPLPAATQMLVDANHILVTYWWAGLLIGAGIYAVWKAFVASPEGRKTWDYFTWHIPVFSLILRYRYYAQFARTLGTLMENGVTLLRALELLEEISGNEYVRLRMLAVRKAVVDGATLSVALGEQKVFPELFVDMMAVGEQTGKLGGTMHMIADVHERELDKQVQVVSTLIPPLVMIAIAAIVGLVVYGILSAVFGLTQGLRTNIR
jgi:type II secretory pathway component PulF